MVTTSIPLKLWDVPINNDVRQVATNKFEPLSLLEGTDQA